MIAKQSFGVRRLDCALIYDGVVSFLFFLRSAKFKSGVKPPHSEKTLRVKTIPGKAG